MISQEAYSGLNARISAADRLYGEFSSTHEAMGVMIEEWGEVRDAIRANDLYAIKGECLDLAAALVRLHDQLESSEALRERSGVQA